MGLGWHVVLQQEVPGVESKTNTGRAVLFAQHDLEGITDQLELASLTSFVSPDPELVADYLRQQGLNPDDFPIPDQQWFAAADGLKTVRGLLAYLSANPGAVADPYRVIQDLQAIEKVLVRAEAAQVAFHLSSDLPSPDSLT